MKIVVAPDSFKGSVTAIEACRAIATGISRVVPKAQIVEIPMADGGEGTVDALIASTGGRWRQVVVSGPLGEEVEATYGILGVPQGASNGEGKTAVIEMAAVAGLALVPEEKRNPLHTTTYGLGQLILDALGHSCRNFIIGIGGSVTTDCGTGFAQAIGVKFFDKSGTEITEPMTGGLMGRVAAVDISYLEPRIKQCSFIVACDVSNPLLGADGANRVYSPQKGADAKAVEILEANMTHIIGLIEQRCGKQVRDIPGAGAAGGLGAALCAFVGAKLKRGIDIVMRYSRFAEKIRSVDLIITGEGQIDETTACGKTISGIAAVAAEQSIPVIALAGSVGPGAEKVLETGVKAILRICSGPMSIEQAMQEGSRLLADAAERALRLVVINPG